MPLRPPRACYFASGLHMLIHDVVFFYLRFLARLPKGQIPKTLSRSLLSSSWWRCSPARNRRPCAATQIARLQQMPRLANASWMGTQSLFGWHLKCTPITCQVDMPDEEHGQAATPNKVGAFKMNVHATSYRSSVICSLGGSRYLLILTLHSLQ